jgi:hypothetical protein
MTLWENGFTAFFDDIAVYHKRRVDFGKFSKQVYQFGCARPILNQRHPNYVKISFAFPTLFMLGYMMGFLSILCWEEVLSLPLWVVYISGAFPCFMVD